MATNLKWAMILCKSKGKPDPAVNIKKFFEDFLIAGLGGALDYWADISFHELDLSGSATFGWFELPATSEEIRFTRRSDAARMGIAAASEKVPINNFAPKLIYIDEPFVGAAVQIGGESGGGSTGEGHVVIDQGARRASFILHEMGHAHGIRHTLYMDGKEYGSPYCLMSAEEFGGVDLSYTCYEDEQFGRSGPGLCSPYTHEAGWLPSSTIVGVPTDGKSPVETKIELNSLRSAPGKRPQVAVVEFEIPFKAAYYVEYRRVQNWDGGFAQDAVVIHQFRPNGFAYYAGAIPSSTAFAGGGFTGSTTVPSKSFADPVFDLFIEILSFRDQDVIELRIAPVGARWAPQQVGFGGESSSGPSLAVFQNKLYAGWKGVEGDTRMFWSSFDGGKWSPQQVGFGGKSSSGPSLAVFQNKLYAGWKGVEGDTRMFWSSFDGGKWSPQQVGFGGEFSSGPSLAVFQNKLYAGWKGVEGDTRMFWSSFDGGKWSPQQVGFGGESSSGPSLAVFQNRLYAAWKGVGSDQRMFWSSFDGTSWTSQQAGIGGGTSLRPSLAAFRGRLYAAWKGTGSDQRMFWSSFDGTNWSPQWEFIDGWSSNGPSLAEFQNRLYAAWKGANDDQRMFWSSFG